MKTKHKRLIIIGISFVLGVLSLHFFPLHCSTENWIGTSLKIIELISSLPAFIIQVLICILIGYIIARLVYPNKKPLPESTEPPEPDK